MAPARGRRARYYSAGSVQLNSWSTRDGAGLPLLSRAGVKRARERMIRHVVASKAEDPLDLVIVQPVTRPLAPTSNVKRTLPCSRKRSAESG